MSRKAKVRTCLWFDSQGEEAAELYVTLLPDSHVESVHRTEPGGPALIVEFTLAGTPYMALNGGPHYQLTPAASVSVLTEDQEETDRLWAALLGDGGREQQCGWLVDRFGLSWQICPNVLPEMLASRDRAAAARVQDAMMKMIKLDIAALQAAFEGESGQ